MAFSGALVRSSRYPSGTRLSDLTLSKISQTLTDLNDFITPAQACIVANVEQKPSNQAEKEPGSARVRTLLSVLEFSSTHRHPQKTEILIDSSGAYYEVTADGKSSSSASSSGPTQKLQQAQISLNDCLACRYVQLSLLPYTTISFPLPFLPIQKVDASLRPNRSSLLCNPIQRCSIFLRRTTARM